MCSLCQINFFLYSRIFHHYIDSLFSVWSFDWLIDWFVVHSIAWLIDWLVDWLFDWLFIRLLDWLLDCLIYRSIDCLIGWSMIFGFFLIKRARFFLQLHVICAIIHSVILLSKSSPIECSRRIRRGWTTLSPVSRRICHGLWLKMTRTRMTDFVWLRKWSLKKTKFHAFTLFSFIHSVKYSHVSLFPLEDSLRSPFKLFFFSPRFFRPATFCLSMWTLSVFSSSYSFLLVCIFFFATTKVHNWLLWPFFMLPTR